MTPSSDGCFAFVFASFLCYLLLSTTADNSREMEAWGRVHLMVVMVRVMIPTWKSTSVRIRWPLLNPLSAECGPSNVIPSLGALWLTRWHAFKRTVLLWNWLEWIGGGACACVYVRVRVCMCVRVCVCVDERIELCMTANQHQQNKKW